MIKIMPAPYGHQPITYLSAYFYNEKLPIKIQHVNTSKMEDTKSGVDFKPKGAIAFFILLIVLCLFIWFGIYSIMLQRS